MVVAEAGETVAAEEGVMGEAVVTSEAEAGAKLGAEAEGILAGGVEAEEILEAGVVAEAEVQLFPLTTRHSTSYFKS